MTADVLITGGGGMLASALVNAFAATEHRVVALTHTELDVTDAAAVVSAVEAMRPRTVIQCAAYTRVDDAEDDEATAMRVNAIGTEIVAEAARRVGAQLVYPSTDYVFDGRATTPYATDAAVNPINAYGRTKAAGERAAVTAGNYLIVRMSWLYGRGGRNFVRTIRDRLQKGLPTTVVDDQTGRPTWTEAAAPRLVALVASDPEPGIYHIGSSGEATWFDVAEHIAGALGASHLVRRCSTSEIGAKAPRPRYSVLDCTSVDRLIGAAAHWRADLDAALGAESF